jgi:hypothetical protein
MVGLLVLAAPGVAHAQTDILGNKRTTATLPKATLRTSTMDFAGDSDWYKITLMDSNAYTITATGPVVIRIYDQAGTLKASSGTSSTYVWRTPATGTHFIAAKHAGGTLGGYTIKVTLNDASANLSTEGRMTVGVTKYGTMTNTGALEGPDALVPDVDWYRIYLEPGSYHFEAYTDQSDDFLSIFGLRDPQGYEIFDTYNPVFQPSFISFDVNVNVAGKYFVEVGTGFVQGIATNTVNVTRLPQ